MEMGMEDGGVMMGKTMGKMMGATLLCPNFTVPNERVQTVGLWL